MPRHLEIFFLKKLFFICVYIDVGGGCCPERPEKGIGCPGSGAVVQLCASLGPGNQSWVL